MPNHSPENLLFSWIALRVSDLTPSFGDLSQSEKLSEIKQPLENIKDLGLTQTLHSLVISKHVNSQSLNTYITQEKARNSNYLIKSELFSYFSLVFSYSSARLKVVKTFSKFLTLP